MAEKGGSNFQNFMSNLGNRHFTSTAMRTFAPAVWVLFVLTFVLPGGATTYYVNSANPAPVSPYVTWSTAATNIQDAVTVASAGDTVLVTNGIYAYGGITQGATTNRVCVTKALTVQSVNGPLATVIQGAGINFNANAVRCAWLTNGATLNGFTLRYGGVVNISSDNSGGGVACYSNAVVKNCLIYFNAAAYGGGTYQGAIQNCLIYSNTASTGGGAYKGSLVNCAINNNGATFSGSGGGGAYNSSLLNCTVTGSTNGYGINNCYATNCIVYYNNLGNVIASPAPIVFCCTTPMPSGGTGNFTNSPGLFADNLHLQPGSPCIGAGKSVAVGADIFGQTWNIPPSIGCAEWQPGPAVLAPALAISNYPAGFSCASLVSGTNLSACFWLQNGTILQDNGHFTGSQTTNLVATGIFASDAGAYQLVASNSYGVVTSSIVQLVIHCTDPAGTNPVPPYLTWATAATNLQDAVNAASPGDLVLATNGVFATGGESMDGVITNRVVVDRAISIQSVNGPGATIIQGNWNPAVTNGPSAIRCVWLTNNAAMSGFTLLGGGTRYVASTTSGSGGGVWGASASNSVLYNCILATNTAYYYGGGAYQVSLNNCELIGNQAAGTTMIGSGIGNGGGAYGCQLYDCLITGNSTPGGNGGGTMNCTLKGCALTRNSGYSQGGADYGSLMINCTASGNLSGGHTPSASTSGAVASAVLTNCIVYGNSVHPYPSGLGGSYGYTNCLNCTYVNQSDTDPLSPGSGNVDINPQLLADGYHLAATSPCLGIGNNLAILASFTDISGLTWSNPPPIGCAQWLPQPEIASFAISQFSPVSRTLSINGIAAGQQPITYAWLLNGSRLTSNGHDNVTGTNLFVSQFDATDAGAYQLVANNSYGSITSAIVQITVHCANPGSPNPVAPYLTWATAATTLQAAIDAASPGDLVLATNGTYSFGGRAYNGGTSNRIVVTQPVTILSMAGATNTFIQGAFDPSTTNGPLAVRCCLLLTNATVTGFTLQGGATLAGGDNGGGGVNGGAAFLGNTVYPSAGVGALNNCILNGNQAGYGGGAYGAILVNCLIINNNATLSGGGAYGTFLTNCTVAENTANFSGGGVYAGQNTITLNSVIYDNYSHGGGSDCYSIGGTCMYSASTAPFTGTGNLVVDPQFIDFKCHLGANSPCRGHGTPLAVQGLDLAGGTWSNAPSMGAYEVNLADYAGSLSPIVQVLYSPNYAGHMQALNVQTGGRATSLVWSWGDGTISSNTDFYTFHSWTKPGTYPVTFTAYNVANPAGVSITTNILVLPILPAALQLVAGGTNSLQIQYTAQTEIFYNLQTSSSLNPPSWSTIGAFYGNGGPQQFNVSLATNAAQFFRLQAN